jgi:hypothetical protein
MTHSRPCTVLCFSGLSPIFRATPWKGRLAGLMMAMSRPPRCRGRFEGRGPQPSIERGCGP